MKFYPYKKAGQKKVLAKLKGSFNRELDILAIPVLKGEGAQQVSILKKGGAKNSTFVLKGGGGGVDPRVFHFVTPPPSIINDQSLRKEIMMSPFIILTDSCHDGDGEEHGTGK